MDEERHTKIRTALRQYREMVLEHNVFLLRILIECIESRPIQTKFLSQDNMDRMSKGLQLEYPLADELDHFAEMYELYQNLQGTMSGPINVQDLLNDNARWELITYHELDGVSVLPVNLKEREDYFAGIQRQLIEKNIEVAEFPPADMEYLCTLVGGIVSMGPPCYRNSGDLDLISLTEAFCLGDLADYVVEPNKVEDLNDLGGLQGIWVNWDIRVAFRIGEGTGWSGSYALYCHNEENKAWKWRYGMHDGEWQSDIYNSVEEFLHFYSHFDRRTEEFIRADYKRHYKFSFSSTSFF